MFSDDEEKTADILISGETQPDIWFGCRHLKFHSRPDIFSTARLISHLQKKILGRERELSVPGVIPENFFFKCCNKMIIYDRFGLWPPLWALKWKQIRLETMFTPGNKKTGLDLWKSATTRFLEGFKLNRATIEINWPLQASMVKHKWILIYH